MQLQRLLLRPFLILAGSVLFLGGLQACSSDAGARQNSYFGYSNDPDRAKEYPAADLEVADAPVSTPAPDAPANGGADGNYYTSDNVNARAGQAAEMRDWDAEMQQPQEQFGQQNDQYYNAENYYNDQNYSVGQSENINYSADPNFNEGANVYIENYYDYSDPNYYGSNVHAASFGPRHHAFNYRPTWSFHLGFGHPHSLWSAAHYRFNYWDDYYCYRPFIGHRAWSSRAWICDPWFYDGFYDPWCPPYYSRGFLGYHSGYWGGYWGGHWGHRHGGYWGGHHYGHRHYGDHEPDRPRSGRTHRNFGANSGVGNNSGSGGGGRVRLAETPNGVPSAAERSSAEVNPRAAGASTSQFGSAASPRTRSSISGSTNDANVATGRNSGTNVNAGTVQSAQPRSPRMRSANSDVASTRSSGSNFGGNVRSSSSDVSADVNPRAADTFSRNRSQGALAPAVRGNTNTTTTQPSGAGVTGSARDRANYNNARRQSRSSRSNVQSTPANGSRNRGAARSTDVNTGAATSQRPNSSDVGSSTFGSSRSGSSTSQTNRSRSTNSGAMQNGSSTRQAPNGANTRSSTQTRSSKPKSGNAKVRSGSSRNSNVGSSKSRRSSAATSSRPRSGNVGSSKSSGSRSGSSVRSSGSSKSSGKSAGGGRKRGRK